MTLFSKFSVLISAIGLFLCLQGICKAENISLNGSDWTLSYWNQPMKAVTSPQEMQGIQMNTIEATVPGNVELDLLKAGLIEDPMIGSNVDKMRSWEGCQWCYTKTFTAPSLKEGQEFVLHFGGIDCIAEIWLNGKHVGSSDNMLIDHYFNVTEEIVQGGSNKLQVILRSVVLESQDTFLGTISMGFFASEEGIYYRKAPHMFGWDILPRLVSAGLWRDVELQVIDRVHFIDVNYFVNRLDTASRSVSLFIETQMKLPIDEYDKAHLVYTLSRNGQVKYRSDNTIVNAKTFTRMNLKNADLWWPRGYGEPALYEAKAEIIGKDGNVLATDVKNIGLRTVQLERNDINLPDSPGKFCFIVNGERIFIHGTNWVPVDALHSRDDSLVEGVIDEVVDLNCNMVRCWGGNVYEDHHFFDLCDKYGILVWQDFAMGCSFYPQREDFARKIEAEAISVVVKLRNHPSLALWSGNNENDASLRGMLWAFNPDPNKDVISRQVLPRVIYEFDPTRPYLPSSPYYSEAVIEHGGGDELLPENHLWGPRGYYKDPFYTDPKCTFVSEIGYHGCPNRESLERMMTKDCVYPWTKDFEWNEEWLTKSVRRYAAYGQTNDRNNLMINQIRLVFGDVPKDLDDFIFASQSVQAEAMKFFIELWRDRKGEKNGILWWNVRDGWPLISDAVTDYWNSKKMAYYFIRNVQKDVCVLINDPEKGACPVKVVNDTRKAADGKVEIVDVASGRKVYNGDFEVSANGKSLITTLPEPDRTGMWLIMYSVGGQKLFNHYLYGKAPYKLNEYKDLLNKANKILKNNGYAAKLAGQ
jgi:beta-mannosidase